MRSTLRETIKRLRRIREKAGRKDEAVEEFTGDPLHDLSMAFIQCVTRTKETIKERDEGMKQHGRDRMCIEQSTAIRKDIRSMEALIEEMKKFADASEAALAHENKKDKPNKRKLNLLQKQRDERAAQYKECLSILEQVQELDLQPTLAGDPEANFQMRQAGRRIQLREQLLTLQRPRRGEHVYTDPNKGMGPQGTGANSGRLEEHEDTKEFMNVIATKNAELDAGLERLKAGVGRLHNVALEIGTQLDMQNRMLDNTERTVDAQLNKVRSINRRIRKFVKETKPVNTFMNVCCIVLIISLVGFFLVQFKVI